MAKRVSKAGPKKKTRAEIAAEPCQYRLVNPCKMECQHHGGHRIIVPTAADVERVKKELRRLSLWQEQ
jgi:hypothetical protein